jgi:periplasmic protein CpxP/Spy
VTRPQRLWIAAAAITALLAVCPGCGSNGPMSASAAESPAAPRFSDINQALKLDDADAAVVKSALAEWKRGANAHKAGARGFAGGRQEMEFIATVTPSLDDEQLSSLVSLFLSRREANRDQMRAHHRGMRGGDSMKLITAELGLSQTQQSQLSALRQETRAKSDAQRESFAGGGVDEDQLRSALQRIREDARTRTEAILTADQLKTFDAMRDERFEKRVERAPDRNDNRLAWLVRTLELNDAQASQVKTALGTLGDAQETAFKGVKTGSLTRDQAHAQMRGAHDAFAETLKGVLNAEQTRRMEILRPLVPGRVHHA